MGSFMNDWSKFKMDTQLNTFLSSGGKTMWKTVFGDSLQKALREDLKKAKKKKKKGGKQKAGASAGSSRMMAGSPGMPDERESPGMSDEGNSPGMSDERAPLGMSDERDRIRNGSAAAPDGRLRVRHDGAGRPGGAYNVSGGSRGAQNERGLVQNGGMSARELQKAVIWSEILGDPVSRKRRRKRDSRATEDMRPQL